MKDFPNTNKPKQWAEEHCRLGQALNKGGCFWSSNLSKNLARDYKRYAYKVNQGRQATTLLSEVGQGECISEKQIDG